MRNSKLLMAVLSLSVIASMSACDRLPIGNTISDNDSEFNLKPSKIVDTDLPMPTTIIDCNSLTPKQTITIQGHNALSQDCELTGKSVRFILDSSHSSLDCQGAMFSTMTGDESSASAITIQPKTDAAIENIAVANCHINGYGHALHIRQYTNPNQRYKRGLTDPAANRALAPKNIRVVNVNSFKSKNSGIFVGDHVSQVTFEQVHVQNAGTVGLYLEFGSRDNVIKNSVFVGNGFRTFKPNREAIAIDSSSNNRIENNTFIHNGAGSIFLYRNCFEHADDPARSNHFKRTESSRDNMISNNLFQDEPVGVWVASRQSRDLKGFACGAYMIKETLFARYHLDSAKDNSIVNNRFEQVAQGVIVEDDGTLISGNTFTKTVAQPISVGSEIREASTFGAIKNTLIKDNTFTDKTLKQAIKITDASKKATDIR